MIKLQKPPKPEELTEAVVLNLTNEFKRTGNSVWSKDYIKQPLLAMSSDKCAFCETKITEESKYLEVEHFHHKDLYKDEVVEWDNLLPSCKKCNATKGDHDTKVEPIINPCVQDPREHLKIWQYRIKGKTSLGKMTVSVLNLNEPDRLVLKRFQIGNALQDKLEEYHELVDDVVSGIQTSTLRKNRIKNGVRDILSNGLKDKEYAATYSTVLITEPEFMSLKSKMNSCHLWTQEHSRLETELSNYALI
ncbi:MULTISPECIES: HNH endonuclease [Vibrio]|uniref:HNH endonuclease n=1 Tax=Vibrio cholerae TaxID=666 RepID=A0A544CA67_VIBCL|nr:HNH endonuclease [Vibrio cholerae]TQP15508.1 HNH endonuclease [Vibrio cholerae]